MGQVEERLYPGRVDVVDSLGVEHDPRGLGRRGADRLAHTALDVLRVCEEEPVVEPVDDDARRHLRRRVQRDVAVALDVGDPSEHGVIGASAAAHRVDDREPDRDDECLEHAEDDDAARRDPRDRDLDPVDRRKRSPGGRVDDVDPRRDDHRARGPPGAGTARARSGRGGSPRSPRRRTGRRSVSARRPRRSPRFAHRSHRPRTPA